MNGLIEAESSVVLAGPALSRACPLPQVLHGPRPCEIPVGAGAPAKGPQQESEISIRAVTSFLHIAQAIFDHPPPTAGRIPARQL